MKNFICFFIGATCATLLLSGCGGGSGGSSTSTVPTGTDQTTALGQMQIKYSGKIQPRIDVGTNGVTVTSATGASFTGVSLFPNKVLANTEIAYFSSGAMYTSQNGIQSQVLGLNQGVSYNPTWTPTGRIGFVGYDEASNSFQVCQVQPDGSSYTKITSSSNIHGIDTVSWTPNYTKIAYDGTSGIYNASVTGSGETLIIPSGYSPAYSPDSTKIVYESLDSAKKYKQIYVLPASGTGTPTLVSHDDTTSNCTYPTWSPDGKWIAFGVDTGTDSFIRIEGTNLQPGINLIVSRPAGVFDSGPTFSPDSFQIAFMRSSSYNGLGSLTTSDFTGQNATTLATNADGGEIAFPSWSGFPALHQYVGSGGSMYTSSVAGFLWGQRSDVFSSFVSFTATTPTTATITPQTAGNGPLVYTIQADNLTGLKYTDAYVGATTSVLPYNGISATSAIVSFSATTGQIDTVAPFVATASAKPKALRVGSTLSYQGKFLGVWNAKGKNIAPAGASKVVLDSKKGTLVSFK